MIVILSSCVAGEKYSEVGHYEIVYGMCPVYHVKHYRKIGKQFNPEECNYVDR